MSCRWQRHTYYPHSPSHRAVGGPATIPEIMIFTVCAYEGEPVTVVHRPCLLSTWHRENPTEPPAGRREAGEAGKGGARGPAKARVPESLASLFWIDSRDAELRGRTRGFHPTPPQSLTRTHRSTGVKASHCHFLNLAKCIVMVVQQGSLNQEGVVRQFLWPTRTCSTASSSPRNL